ncbi:MAG: hypothetical protein U0793_18440 [Gemmataceae bacterium]
MIGSASEDQPGPHFNVLALVKGKERFIFVYDDDSRADLIDAPRHQAADPK